MTFPEEYMDFKRVHSEVNTRLHYQNGLFSVVIRFSSIQGVRVYCKRSTLVMFNEEPAFRTVSFEKAWNFAKDWMDKQSMRSIL